MQTRLKKLEDRTSGPFTGPGNTDEEAEAFGALWNAKLSSCGEAVRAGLDWPTQSPAKFPADCFDLMDLSIFLANNTEIDFDFYKPLGVLSYRAWEIFWPSIGATDASGERKEGNPPHSLQRHSVGCIRSACGRLPVIPIRAYLEWAEHGYLVNAKVTSRQWAMAERIELRANVHADWLRRQKNRQPILIHEVMRTAGKGGMTPQEMFDELCSPRWNFDPGCVSSTQKVMRGMESDGILWRKSPKAHRYFLLNT